MFHFVCSHREKILSSSIDRSFSFAAVGMMMVKNIKFLMPRKKLIILTTKKNNLQNLLETFLLSTHTFFDIHERNLNFSYREKKVNYSTIYTF